MRVRHASKKNNHIHYNEPISSLHKVSKENDEKRCLIVAKFTLFCPAIPQTLLQIDERFTFHRKKSCTLVLVTHLQPTPHQIIHCVYASAQENYIHTISIQQRSRNGCPKKRNLSHSTQLVPLRGYRIIVFKRSHRIYQTIFFSQPKNPHSTLQRTHRIHKAFNHATELSTLLKRTTEKREWQT